MTGRNHPGYDWSHVSKNLGFASKMAASTNQAAFQDFKKTYSSYLRLARLARLARLSLFAACLPQKAYKSRFSSELIPCPSFSALTNIRSISNRL